MKHKLLKTVLVVASSLIAVSALAQSNMGMTRDQVIHEYLEAKKAGTLPIFLEGENINAPASAPSMVSREQVLREFELAKKLGKIPSYSDGGVSYSTPEVAAWEFDVENLPATAAGGLTRDQVIQEYLKAKEEGTLPPIYIGD
ncbi:MAG: DUF4148 domain-containing protein [Burkholderiaceae bacterium]